MASPSEHLKNILVTAGIGAFGGVLPWAIYISKMPDTPDACITLYDSGGETPNPAWLLDFPSVQVRLRAGENDYQALYQKVKDIVDALLGYPSTDVSDGRLVSIRMDGGPAFLGYEEKKRPQFSINWTLIFEPNTSALTNRESL